MTQKIHWDDDDLADLLNGATFYGSGGGGPKKMGEIVNALIKKKGFPKMVPPSAMADDDWAVIAAGVGSPEASGDFKPEVVAHAVDVMETAMSADMGKDIKLSHMMAVEIGAGNTYMPIASAITRGCAVIDGAAASRAIPKITMSTLAAAGIDVGYMTLANDDAQMTLKAGAASTLSAPMRSLLSNPPFDQVAGLAIWPIQGKVVKELAIAGTITKAREFGAAVRKADNKVQAAIDASGGVLLGQGVATTNTQIGGAFDHTVVTVTSKEGTELQASAQVLNIIALNENLFASTAADGPVAAAPDLISYIHPKTGVVVSNVELKDQDEIAVIGSPAGPKMLQGTILAQFKEVLQDPVGYYGKTPLLT